MDTVNLKAASAYLNNLLLARGLLRNGKPIEFARPHKADGGTEATMAQIINLVHDMVLKRDREQEQRESLAETIRKIRSESNQTTIAHERLQSRFDDMSRQLSLSQSQEKSARAASRTAEATTRGLRDELVRLKASVQQIRASCANDIRKRDVQIQKLKTHLNTQQRGNRGAPTSATITITPGLGTNASRDDASPLVDDPEYTLRQESTEFLTQLSQSLSDENDNLIGLIRSTLATLKELQGLPENAQRISHEAVIVEEEDQDDSAKMVQALPTSYDTLATDMDHVLDSLRNLLTNPNFVPIEEVSIREEEIAKLREGWDKMELKWKEAIVMMDGWRKRMLNGGEMVNVEEIKRGLGLGRSLNIKHDFSASVMVDTSLSDMDEDSVQSDYSSDDSDLATCRTGPTLQARMSMPLAEGNANRSPRKVNFEREQRQDDTSKNPSPPTKQSGLVVEYSPQFTRKSRKRHSSPEPLPDERSPKLTVQEKLNVAQAEAEAAAVAAGLNLEDVNIQVSMVATLKDSQPEQAKVKRHLQKTRISGRPKRRKSTLTPDELENLMFNH